jgi:hypothetical protein
MTLGVRAAVLTVLLGLTWTTAAGAQTVVVTQQLFDADGHPRLVANSSPDGSRGTPTWARCAGSSDDCEPIGTGNVVAPGPAAPGTTFEARLDDQGHVTRARTSPWGGTVTLTGAPALGGRVEARERVTPVAGRWTGGWGDEYDRLGVAVCRTADARDCLVLSEQGQTEPFAMLGNAHTGRWAFAFDLRTPRQAAFASVLYRYPRPVADLRAPAAGSLFGPIGLSEGRRVLGPVVRLRAGAAYRSGRPIVGTVRCRRACRIRVSLRRGGARHFVDVRLGGAGAVRLVPRLPRAGTWRARLTIDGELMRVRTIRVG